MIYFVNQNYCLELLKLRKTVTFVASLNTKTAKQPTFSHIPGHRVFDTKGLTPWSSTEVWRHLFLPFLWCQPLMWRRPADLICAESTSIRSPKNIVISNVFDSWVKWCRIEVESRDISLQSEICTILIYIIKM